MAKSLPVELRFHKLTFTWMVERNAVSLVVRVTAIELVDAQVGREDDSNAVTTPLFCEGRRLVIVWLAGSSKPVGDTRCEDNTASIKETSAG